MFKRIILDLAIRLQCNIQAFFRPKISHLSYIVKVSLELADFSTYKVPLRLLLSKWARLFMTLQTLKLSTSFNHPYYYLTKYIFWPSPLAKLSHINRAHNGLQYYTVLGQLNCFTLIFNNILNITGTARIEPHTRVS